MWLLFFRNKLVECINAVYSFITNSKNYKSLFNLLLFTLIVVSAEFLVVCIFYGFGILTNLIFNIFTEEMMDTGAYLGLGIATCFFLFLFSVITYWCYKFIFFMKIICIKNYKLAKNNTKVKFIWKD